MRLIAWGRKGYRLIQILSLDVVFGALASGRMVVWWLEVEVPQIWWWILPLSVWVIYTLDHLLDARNLREAAHTERHLFHHRYRRFLWPVWGLAFLSCGLIFPWFMPTELWYFGIGMGGLVLGHLALVSIMRRQVSNLVFKEFGVGIIYAMGIWGFPFFLALNELTWVDYSVFFQFYLLAMLNLIGFSLYEQEIDALDGHTSFVRTVGPKVVSVTLCCFLILFFVLMLFNLTSLWSLKTLLLMGIYLIMAGVLSMIIWLPGWFGAETRYRAWADGVFLLPALVVLS